MKLIFIAGFIILIAGIIIFLRAAKKKKSFKSGETLIYSEEHPSTNERPEHQEKFHSQKGISSLVDNIKGVDSIRPEGNQQRNLDRETGGLEEEQNQEQNHEKDVWDDRSEEVDKMGAIDQLGSTGKKSMIWRHKKEKMEEKKMDKAKNASEAHQENRKGKGKNYDSRGQKGGFLTMVQAKQDNEQGGGGRGI